MRFWICWSALPNAAADPNRSSASLAIAISIAAATRSGEPGRPQVGQRVADDPHHRGDDGLVVGARRTGPCRGRGSRAWTRGSRCPRQDRGAASFEHLGREVEHGAEERARRGVAAVDALDHRSHAEVGQLALAGHVDQHVLGLDVAMEHAGPVRGIERVAELHADAQDLRCGQRPARLDPIGQRAPGHVLHGQVGGPLDRGARVVDADHVGMAREGADRGALALEPADRDRVDEAAEHLDRDRPVEGQLRGPVHHREPALPDDGEVGVPVDARDTHTARVGGPSDRRLLTSSATPGAPRRRLG